MEHKPNNEITQEASYENMAEKVNNIAEEDLEVIRACPTKDYVLGAEDLLIIFTKNGCGNCDELLNNISELEVEEEKAPKEVVIVDADLCNLAKEFEVNTFPTVIRAIRRGDRFDMYSVEGYDIDGLNKLLNLDGIDNSNGTSDTGNQENQEVRNGKS
jgi:thiol-disulfide isomerase/thioredoxin